MSIVAMKKLRRSPDVCVIGAFETTVGATKMQINSDEK